MNISEFVPAPLLAKISQPAEYPRIEDTSMQQKDSEKSLLPRSVASTSTLGNLTTSEVGRDNTALIETSKLTDIDNEINSCPSGSHFKHPTDPTTKADSALPDNCDPEAFDSEPEDLVVSKNLKVRIGNPRPGSPWPTAAAVAPYPTPLRAMRTSRAHSTYPKGRRTLIRDMGTTKAIPTGGRTRCVRPAYRKGLAAQPFTSKALPDPPLRNSLPHGDVLPQL